MGPRMLLYMASFSAGCGQGTAKLQQGHSSLGGCVPDHAYQSEMDACKSSDLVVTQEDKRERERREERKSIVG